MIVDGFTTGLGAAIWALGATLGILTALAPWATAGWLLSRTIETIGTSRPAWWLRAQRSTRRARGS